MLWLRSALRLTVVVVVTACGSQGPAATQPASAPSVAETVSSTPTPTGTPQPTPTSTLAPTLLPTAPPTPTPIPQPTATAPTTPVASGDLPAPLAAWSLRGNGEPSVGDLRLEFEGGYTSTVDGTAFDGLTGRAVSQGPSPVDATKSVTLSAWVSHPYQLVDVPHVVSLTGDDQLRMALAIAGAWYFGTTAADLSGGLVLRSNEWLHVAGVSDRESGALRLYVDGHLIAQKPAGPPLPAPGPLIIGGGLPTDMNWWSGAVADVAVYQAALTDGQIAEIYSTTMPDGPPPEWSPDPPTYANGQLDGTWDYQLRAGRDQQVIDQLESDSGQTFDSPNIRLGFDGPLWWQGVAVDGQLLEMDGETIGDIGLIHVDGDQLTIRSWIWNTTYQWALDGDELSLTFVQECGVRDGICFDRDQIAAVDPLVVPNVEHTFTRSGNDATY